MGKPIQKICVWCEGAFLAARGAYQTGGNIKPIRQRFCSKSCSNQARYQEPKGVKQLSVADAAYIAAYLDGEGSIARIKRRRSARPSLRVLIVNTHKKSLDWVAEVTGAGLVRNKPTNPDFPNAKPCYVWYTHSGTALAVLEQILPYMIIKRDLAEAALAELHELNGKSVRRA